MEILCLLLVHFYPQGRPFVLIIGNLCNLFNAIHHMGRSVVLITGNILNCCFFILFVVKVIASMVKAEYARLVICLWQWTSPNNMTLAVKTPTWPLLVFRLYCRVQNVT